MAGYVNGLNNVIIDSLYISSLVVRRQTKVNFSLVGVWRYFKTIYF